MSSHTAIAIIGAGFGGIGAAVRLRQAGHSDLLIFERAEAIGGVWRDNSYPGCACDVPSHLYSFSFAHNPDWSRSYSHQPEIWAYLQRCVARFGLEPHLRLGHTLLDACWDSTEGRWLLNTDCGPFTADALVLASGALSEPRLPDLPGLGAFAGKLFHSARWDHSYDLAGKRVAVVGTGASAVQFIPALQPLVAQLVVFQRTAPWVLPRRERTFSLVERRLFARFPVLCALERGLIYSLRELLVLALRHPRLMRVLERVALHELKLAVPDPALRARLTPSFRMGCKRILSSDTYLPALAQPNVALVTAPIAEVRTHSVVDAAGAEWPVDAIICGTGFQVTTQPIARHVRGRDGRTLAQAWGGSPQAHLGTAIAGFPNLFMLQGPNTGLGHSSVIYMIERQIELIVQALNHLRARGLRTLEPRPEAQAAFVAAVDRAMQGSVWTAGGCASWYLDATGRNSTLWPGFTWQFGRRLRRFEPGEFVLG
jgi:cation diffusion facilitator CzcD-associated flavoprotein CzcO